MPRHVDLPMDIVKDLYEVQGLTLDDIARRLGTSHGTVRRKAIQAGIKMRSRGPGLRRIDDAEAQVLVTGTLESAGARLGITAAGAHYRRQRLIRQMAREDIEEKRELLPMGVIR